MSYEEQEYHRRRAEMELESAVSADEPKSAIAHLALARMHRERRQNVAQTSRQLRREKLGLPALRTDKEA